MAAVIGNSGGGLGGGEGEVRGRGYCGGLFHRTILAVHASEFRDLPGVHQMEYPKSLHHEIHTGASYLQCRSCM